MSFNDIPQELRLYNQWCLWRNETINEKLTKVPYQLNGNKLDTTNPQHCASFDAVVNYKIKLNGHSGFDGIGFIFSSFDPYCGIDLDYTDDPQKFERQQKIYTNFNSYSELSPSGKGLHIICKGEVPNGRKREKIEVYSSGRYFTFTGDIINQAPIAHRQELLDILWAEMGPEVPTYDLAAISQNQLFDDQYILKQATNAANGDKFCKLMMGDWSGLYPSQSEADFAIIDMLAFYSQNIDQIKRLWLLSGLSKRNKQTSIKGVPYLDHMINRAFDRQLPFIDLSQITVNGRGMQEGAAPGNKATPSHGTGELSQAMPGIGANVGEANTLSSAAAAKLVGEAIAVKAMTGDQNWPPGLLGDIAKFIYAQAAKPVYEIALAGAIGLMSGICGRTYNVSGTGLNQYVLALAMTGANKEAAASGISKLMGAVKVNIPSAMDFIGPGDIKSDAGLIKWIDKKPCFVSIVGEFGLRFRQMSSTRNNPHEVGIKRVLLDLYNKSGRGAVLNPLAYSDKDKNTNYISSPSFSLLGEGVPETFYESLNDELILDGLLPRFLIIEYKGKSPKLSKTHKDAYPSKQLVDNVSTVMAQCMGAVQSNNVCDVKLTNEAESIFDELEEFSRNKINNSQEVVRQLWNRAHIKSLKLAATLAVGVNFLEPLITKDNAVWAIQIVTKDIESLSKRFEVGDVGEESKLSFASDDNQLDEMTRVISRWIKKEEIPKYGMNDKMLGLGIYTFSALQMRLNKISCFRKDKMGSTFAFKRAIQSLLDSGDIQELNSSQVANDFGKRARCFKIVDYGRFVSEKG